VIYLVCFVLSDGDAAARRPYQFIFGQIHKHNPRKMRDNPVGMSLSGAVWAFSFNLPVKAAFRTPAERGQHPLHDTFRNPSWHLTAVGACSSAHASRALVQFFAPAPSPF
jgi:hypothetical protein